MLLIHPKLPLLLQIVVLAWSPRLYAIDAPMLAEDSDYLRSHHEKLLSKDVAVDTEVC